MGNRASNVDGAMEAAQSRQLSNQKRNKNALKCEYDYVFSDDDPRSWLPTDLTKSKLDLLDAKLCPGAPPPTHVSTKIPKSSSPITQSSLSGSFQIEMAPFTFSRSRGQYPEGLGTFSKSTIPSFMLLSKSSTDSSERSPAKMAQGDPYIPYYIEELRNDKNYKPAWLPEVKPSYARTNLSPDSQADKVRRSRSFFGFKPKKSMSKDLNAGGESKSLAKIDQRSRSLTTHKSLGESILHKWRRAIKSENDAEAPLLAIDEKSVYGSTASSYSTYAMTETYSYESYSSDGKPPGKPNKPPPKKEPEKPKVPPKEEKPKKEEKYKKQPTKKPPQPPKKARPVESSQEMSSPQDADGGESGGGSRSGVSYSSTSKAQGGKSTPESGSGTVGTTPAYSASTSGNATPSGGKGKGGGKKRPPPPPVFISNCCTGLSKKSSLTPADRLENVDIVEELVYNCPTEDGCGCGGGNGNDNNCCCDYYCCCNECGECKPIPNCCGNNNKPNPVKYSRRQRFNFNDGKNKSDDYCDGPPFYWQDRRPNPFDEIPVGKNPVITGLSGCECEDTDRGQGKVLPSESGTYFFDAEKRSFVPVLEIETPETPQQEVEDEIIDEEPVLTNIEPIIQPMMQPMCGGCCPLPPFCGMMGQPCCINPCGNDSDNNEKDGKKRKSKSSNKGNKDNGNCSSCKPDPGMMGLCGMNMQGLANMGPYGSLIVPQFNYQPPPCPPCHPCGPCPPDCPCCPAGEQSPCCPCPPCQPMSCAPICFPPYGGYPMCCQGGCNKKKKKKDKKKKKRATETSTQHASSYNTGTNTNSAYGGAGGSNDSDDE